jgi:hypothetical protein
MSTEYTNIKVFLSINIRVYYSHSIVAGGFEVMS